MLRSILAHRSPVADQSMICEDRAPALDYHLKAFPPRDLRKLVSSDLNREPFIGDPNTATVVLLNLNPGHCAADEPDHRRPAIKKSIFETCVRNRKTTRCMRSIRNSGTPALKCTGANTLEFYNWRRDSMTRALQNDCSSSNGSPTISRNAAWAPGTSADRSSSLSNSPRRWHVRKGFK
jgi:hypothetical protein